MQTFFGGLMVAAGMLISGASGLCTLSIALPMLHSPGASEGGSLVVLCLIFGGLPFGLGLLLIWGGVMTIRHAKPNDGGGL